MTAFALVVGCAVFALVVGRLVARFDRPLFGPLNEAEARPRGAYDHQREDHNDGEAL